MKLAKALKEKNRLVGEVNRLKGLIQRENSRDVKSTSKVDVALLWDALTNATTSLVAIKTAIFKANIGIYDKIVLMGELKAKAEWIKSLDTKDGIVEENTHYANPIVKEYKAYLNTEAIDNLTVELQEQIVVLQDEIDEYNATLTV
jgi:hypothetical protein